MMGFAEFIIGRAFARPVGSAHPTNLLCEQHHIPQRGRPLFRMSRNVALDTRDTTMAALARNISRFSETHMEIEALKALGLLSCVGVAIFLTMVSI
jgi:hypothetical protein